MSAPVRIEEQDGVAVVLIDNPPINASSRAVRAGLLEAVNEAGRRDSVQALVLIGAGTTFIAGADLREFDLPLAEPQLPAVIAAVEACPKPVVAALHGAALGGGLELALGCDARIALAGTQLGLPEVTLGIIPGAGGTQRLPRLVGMAEALALICSGERIAAARALQLGLVDRVIDADLRPAAVSFARSLQVRKRRVRELPVPAIEEPVLEQAAAAALRSGRGRPAVRDAIEAVQAARTLPIDQALAQERERFQALRGSTEARALRHQFFAERQAGRLAVTAEAVPQPIRRVAILGAGTMGTGIAIAALDAGLAVTVLDREPQPLERGVERIRDYYAGRSAAGKLDAAEAAARLQRLAHGTDWQLLATADLIIEAVFEDLEIKKDVFAQLDRIARPEAILASNTSYLDLDAIAAATSRPAQVVGLHFFSPAQVMRLLEIVRAAHTSPQVLASALKFARTLRKVPVIAGNAFGFIGNRLYAAYRRQCEFLLEEGALPQQVDAALEAFGFAMGPFAVGDLSGLDIAWRMRKATAATRDPEARYVRIPDRLCEAGRLGRKSGAGYYRYVGATREVDPQVEQLIVQIRAEQGLTARPIAAAEIVERALLALLNEAALVLAAGVAQRPEDIDVVMVNGYGFPKWQGGPVFWARQQDRRWLKAALDRLAQASGPGFVRGDLARLFTSDGEVPIP